MPRQTTGTGTSIRVRIPSYVRPRLSPYANVFENVVLPIAGRVRAARPSQKLKIELRESVDAALLAAVGFVPHPWLVRCGLLLCCYHAFQQSGEQRRTILTATYRLLHESFDLYTMEDSQLFL